MKSKVIAQLMADLGITKTHIWPHVRNDNPYSEAQFKTLKYAPAFPHRFGSIQDSRSFCQDFFTRYNKEHRHSGVGLMTPQQVHYGLSSAVLEHRSRVLKGAFHSNPKRFKNKIPKPLSLPEASWLNRPSSDDVRV
jgi:putative transposase